MDTPWLDTLLGGITNQPHNGPEELTIRFANGSSVNLTGVSLQSFWVELVLLKTIVARAQEGPPPLSADAARSLMNQVRNRGLPKTQTPKDKKDESPTEE